MGQGTKSSTVFGENRLDVDCSGDGIIVVEGAWCDTDREEERAEELLLSFVGPAEGICAIEAYAHRVEAHDDLLKDGDPNGRNVGTDECKWPEVASLAGSESGFGPAAFTHQPSMKAIVKSVISGDSLVLRHRGPQGQPPKERILHLADVSSPKLGNASREDEPWAYEAREFLRALTVGKEILFSSSHELPRGKGDIPRDIGHGEVNGVDITNELLLHGWAKVKDSKREPTDDDLRRKGLESEAKSASRGQWNPHGPKARQVIHNMPLDLQGFISEWRGKQLDAIVESVRDGTTVRVRLFMPDGEHRFVNITLAGARSPRAASKQGETSEPWGDDAKYFTESRLLQRAVKVQLLSLPTMKTNGSSTRAPASIFIGIVLHPAGNIVQFLLGAGLAHFVEWHSGMLAPYGGSEKLRAADRAAKEKRLGLHANG